ncbi:hypothetical protein NHX12_012801 [Muraenolepis orangiensis]|uniref:G-protein coupled receptors family 1 profile domain-containing protein n=1 Tax=Muraenolepis orangiensis TaxID=630683 RepID=A0A9Q0DDD0_9TELE|nr:hypothetical protein NHX12_012801 [Muraenolepis orangiensis]
MDPRSCWNETAPRREAQVSALFLVFNCVVLSLSLVLGLLANLLVCWVVFRNKNLRTSNNALLISLAASDLLKCSVDTPLLLGSFLLGSGGEHLGVSGSLCALQQFSYALCGCVQLLTLVGISVERFHAIAFPFQTERRRTRIRVWIPSVWVCGLLLAVVSPTLSKRALYYLLCRRSPREQPPYTDPLGAYVLVPVWGFSLTLIVIYYARIFKVVRRHRKRVFDNGVELRPTARHVWRWFRCAASDPGTAPPPAAPTGPRRTGLPLLPAVMCRPPGRLITVAEAGPALQGGKPLRRPPPEIAGAVCLLTPLARERGKKRMEGKVAKRFGYMILVSTLFWVPLVLTLLITILWGQSIHWLVVQLETSAVVLTCVPAAVDPLIYTMVTRQFRSELRKILSSLAACPRRGVA